MFHCIPCSIGIFCNNPRTIPDGYLTTSGIAKQLNLTELWVGKLIRRGTFSGAKKRGHSWIIPSKSVD
ncbi:hypothetical protein VQL36_03940 [Chengkuizengella sp. SCS-71B]|uniref:hypothetical protein n=1 Tax=Chengkuizengella sp. SCS-71B TaxID=3115290 RepID=UPI0032C2333B